MEHTSRAALADVREAIRGYRSDGIFAELARARATLETAGVTVECETARGTAQSCAGDPYWLWRFVRP